VAATALAIPATGLPLRAIGLETLAIGPLPLAIPGTAVRQMVLLVPRLQLSRRVQIRAIARAVQVILRARDRGQGTLVPGRRQEIVQVEPQLSGPQRRRARGLAQTKLAAINARRHRTLVPVRRRVLTPFPDPVEAVHKVHAETRVSAAAALGEAHLVASHRRSEFQ
jgi:hypothetical protein